MIYSQYKDEKFHMSREDFAVGKMHRMLVVKEKFAYTWNSWSKSQLWPQGIVTEQQQLSLVKADQSHDFKSQGWAGSFISLAQ